MTLSNYTHDRNDEAELLFLLGSLRHENIVELLAAYTKDGVSNLLFAPAELDLHDFLFLPNWSQGFEEEITILKALHGLLSAVAYLHNFRSRPPTLSNLPGISMNGYHHDIKPRNVLVRGTNFILADFGLSKLKDQEDSTKTLWKDSTFEYGAPECRDSETFASGKIGRSFDIWSLGCVFSEVLVYMETGSEGVLKFRTRRVIVHKYGRMRCFHDGTHLSFNVTSYLDDIEKQTKSSIIANLLFIIRKTFAEHADDRPSAQDLEKSLACIVIEESSHVLLTAIERCIEDTTTTVDINLFRTRLALEKNRLLAWIRVLGTSINHSEEYRQQALPFFSQFWKIIRTTIDELEMDSRFDSTQNNNDFILTTLHNANNNLCNPLSDDVKASIDNSFSVLSTLTMDSQSLQGIESATMNESPQYQDVGALAAMKYMSILVSQKTLENSEYFSIDAAMIRKDASIDDPETRSQTYHYSYGYLPGEERKILVEWKGYGAQWKKDIGDEKFEQIGAEIFQRIQGLVAMLKHYPKPPEFRVLDCLGAFHHTQRQQFGIVYGFPTSKTTSVRLHKLLRGKGSAEMCPDPSQKLALAKALVASVNSFQISGWVHKNINSYNIIFFTEAPNDWANIDLSDPYIIGFHHSRKNNVGAYTEGPDQMNAQKEYQHPKYRQGSDTYQRSYDYYSLGLVLLEIGTWISLSNIYDHYPTHSPDMLRIEYIKCCETQLRIFMGPTYYLATKKCLEFDQLVNQDDTNLSLEFQTEVIDKLRSCRY